jgi:hypothetical protein
VSAGASLGWATRSTIGERANERTNEPPIAAVWWWLAYAVPVFIIARNIQYNTIQYYRRRWCDVRPRLLLLLLLQKLYLQFQLQRIIIILASVSQQFITVIDSNFILSFEWLFFNLATAPRGYNNMYVCV